MLATLLMLQAAPEAIDLTRLPGAPSRCEQQPAEPTDEVVVCGRKDQPYRLKPLTERYAADAPLLPEAKVALPGVGTVTAHGEKGSVGNIPTNRAMVTLKVPF